MPPTMTQTTMLNRKVSFPYWRKTGTIIAWEPLSSGLTDILVRHPDGTERWYASHDARPIDGRGPIPSRREAQNTARQRAIACLEKIRADHVRDFTSTWPGMEFGKAIFGQSVDAALAELKKP